MSDLFHPEVPFEFIDKVWDTMFRCPQHTFQILTKRLERMAEYIENCASWKDLQYKDFLTLDELYYENKCGYVFINNEDKTCNCNNGYLCGYQGESEEAKCEHGFNLCFSWNCPIAVHCVHKDNIPTEEWEYYEFDDEGYTLDHCELMHIYGRPKKGFVNNVHLGTPIEDQKTADERIPILLQIPAAVRFVSVEPLIEEISIIEKEDIPDWVIIGGESGPKARPCKVEWIRNIVHQCQEAGVPVFVKQMGTVWAKENGVYKHDTKGANMKYWDADLRVREYPKEQGK